MSYPSLNQQIKEFGVYTLINGKFIKAFWITSTADYNHSTHVIHHFIKEQEYYTHPERYKGKQRLIYMRTELHNDIHSAMSDERFFKKHNISLDTLLYRRRKA